MATEKENSSVDTGTKIYKIQVDVKRIKGEKEGKKYDFLTYTAYDKRGKKSKLKFTKTAQNVPADEGCFTLTILTTNINRDKSTKYNEYWVKNVESYEIYDGFTATEDDLPF